MKDKSNALDSELRQGLIKLLLPLLLLIVFVARLAELMKLTPVFEANIDGLPYVQIYRP